MIKILLVLFCSLLTQFVSGQIVHENSSKSKSDYYSKYKQQNNIGSVLLTAGTTSLIIGTIWASVDSKGIFNNDFDAQAIMVVGGVLTMIGSVPFYISARRNKEKARRIVAKFELDQCKEKLVLHNCKTNFQIVLAFQLK